MRRGDNEWLYQALQIWTAKNCPGYFPQDFQLVVANLCGHRLKYRLQPPPPSDLAAIVGEDVDTEADEPRVREAILQVLQEAGRRLTRPEIDAECRRRGWTYADSSLKEVLSRLKREGLVNNDQDVQPPGYGLV